MLLSLSLTPSSSVIDYLKIKWRWSARILEFFDIHPNLSMQIDLESTLYVKTPVIEWIDLVSKSICLDKKSETMIIYLRNESQMIHAVLK